MVVTSGQLNSGSSSSAGVSEQRVQTMIDALEGKLTTLINSIDTVDRSELDALQVEISSKQDSGDYALREELNGKQDQGDYALRNDIDPYRISALGYAPADFGAVGDGVADDTAALQQWLDSGQKTLQIPAGVYRTTAELTINIDGAVLSGTGTTILYDGTADGTVLKIASDDVTVVGLVIDANNKAQKAIFANGARAVIDSNTIRSVRSTTAYAVAIECDSFYGFKALNNKISDVRSTDNSVMGDSLGASRAIYYTHGGNSLEPSVISGNLIERIEGEEGDGIQIVMNNNGDVTAPFWSAQVTIENNTLWDCSRRYIKVQASDVVVRGNVMNSTYTTSPSNPSECILVSRADRVSILSNIIYKNLLLRPLNVSGSAEYYCHDITVDGNVIYQPGDRNTVSLSINWARNSAITNNVTTGGGVGCAAATTDDTVIAGNTSFSTDNTAKAFSANGNCNRVIIKDNINMNPGRLDPFVNYSTGGIMENNVTLT